MVSWQKAAAIAPPAHYAAKVWRTIKKDADKPSFTRITKENIMDTRKDENELLLLGGSTVYKQDYAPEVLEAFTNKHPDNDYWVRFNCPEFTSLCPITGQPDFATIYIDYIPDIKMEKSKRMKLYLFNIHNHRAFKEEYD